MLGSMGRRCPVSYARMVFYRDWHRRDSKSPSKVVFRVPYEYRTNLSTIHLEEVLSVMDLREFARVGGEKVHGVSSEMGISISLAWSVMLVGLVAKDLFAEVMEE